MRTSDTASMAFRSTSAEFVRKTRGSEGASILASRDKGRPIRAVRRAYSLRAPATSSGHSLWPFRRRKLLRLALGAAALPAASRLARAGGHPTRPVRLVIPFPPGGAFDAVGRPWADRDEGRYLAWSSVENMGGGGGSIGRAVVARPTRRLHTAPGRHASRTSTRPCSRVRRCTIRSKDLDPIAGVAANVLVSLCILRCRRRR